MCCSGSDYVPFDLSGEFIPANQDQTLCFDLTVVEDRVVEESEVLFISLSSQDSAVRIPEDASLVNITIIDNDSKQMEGEICVCANFDSTAFIRCEC